MDDQNQPNSQLNNQPKKDEQDVSSSAPVEMEPETQSSMPPVSKTPGSTSSGMPPMDEGSDMPQPPVTPVSTPTPLLTQEKPEGLLEAPKKKNGMYVALIAVVLVIALGFLGYMVYKTLYP
jgi:hypothetical protein